MSLGVFVHDQSTTQGLIFIYLFIYFLTIPSPCTLYINQPIHSPPQLSEVKFNIPSHQILLG